MVQKKEEADQIVEAALDAFDMHVLADEYENARAVIRGVEREATLVGRKRVLETADRVLDAIKARQDARNKGLAALAGQKVRLCVGGRVRACTILAVKGDVFEIEESFSINRRTVTSRSTLRFADLDRGEIDRLAAVKAPGNADEHMAVAIAAMVKGDLATTKKAIEAAGTHPLAVRYRRKLEDQTRSSAGPEEPGKKSSVLASGPFGFRTPEGRKACVAKYGGSDASEQAVELALKWIAVQQGADGRWSGVGEHGFRYGNAADVGLTGLAVLAFLGAGYTHKEGPYRENVARALRWLVSIQDGDPESKKRGGIYLPRDAFKVGKSWMYADGGAYGHAIAGLALGEAYGMTRDEALREPVRLAADHSVKVHQKPGSGWRYRPQQDADLSVTGWYLAQLKTADLVGIEVEPAAFQGGLAFVNAVTDKQGRAKYSVGVLTDARENRIPTPSMTAVGLTSRFYLGARPNDPLLRNGAAYLCKYLPRWNHQDYPVDMPKVGDGGPYYWYYGTLAMFHAGGQAWTAWNGALRDMLMKNQCKAKNGKALTGSWLPPGREGKKPSWLGRFLSTVMSAMCLEVYYRYDRTIE